MSANKRKSFYLALLLLFSWSQTAASPFQIGKALFEAMSVSDAKFTGDVLREKWFPTILRCALDCANDARCGTFTFTPPGDGSEGGSCRIHGKRQHLLGDREPAPGALSFLRQLGDLWIETACHIDADCGEEGALCLTGQCLCDASFFYDFYQNACENNCSRALGGKYVRYDAKDVGGSENNLHVLYGIDDPDAICAANCTATPGCLGYNYIADWRQCYMKNSTAQFTNKWWDNGISIFHQRTCQ